MECITLYRRESVIYFSLIIITSTSLILAGYFVHYRPKQQYLDSLIETHEVGILFHSEIYTCHSYNGCFNIKNLPTMGLINCRYVLDIRESAPSQCFIPGYCTSHNIQGICTKKVQPKLCDVIEGICSLNSYNLSFIAGSKRIMTREIDTYCKFNDTVCISESGFSHLDKILTNIYYEPINPENYIVDNTNKEYFLIELAVMLLGFLLGLPLLLVSMCFIYQKIETMNSL